MPSALSGSNAVANQLWQSQCKISGRSSMGSVASDPGSRKVPLVGQQAQFAAVASIEDVDPVLVQLETRLDDVLSVGENEVVVELDRRGSKVFEGDHVANTRQRATTRLGNGAALAEREQGKAFGSDSGDAQAVCELAHGTTKPNIVVDKRNPVETHTSFIHQIGSEGVGPIDEAIL